jgi:2-polyprenyl-3-methyl-5-hydroxy-6-metoxy-1,4-benzoquinol methylase
MSQVPSDGDMHEDPRIAYFNEVADRWGGESPDHDKTVARLESYADLLCLTPGLDILEAGCGLGIATGWLSEQVKPGTVTAVDFSPQMINIAQSKGIAAEFNCMDICRDELGEDCYDVVFCLHSFPHFRDQQLALNRLEATLRQNGRLIVMHLSGSEQINRHMSSLGDPVGADLLPQGSTWISMLRQAGLELNRMYDQDDLFFLEAVRPSNGLRTAGL